MAAFPPRVPHYFIDRFTQPGDVVLDPFCGRGTTPAEACLMGRIGIGSDLNPIAHVLTKAKVQPPTKQKLLSRILQLESDFTPLDTSETPSKIKMLYSTKTLQQLIFLKQQLRIKRSVVDNFIMALLLGGMHGNSSKQNYMSIPMPNTFSMSPNYVRKYIRTHKLKPPSHDSFTVMRYRLERLYKERRPPVKGRAYCRDIRRLPTTMRGHKADLVLTSPPYLKVIKYGKLNWIRLWMLDVDPTSLDLTLDDKHTVPKYMDFMKSTINTIGEVMKNDALCFIVVGRVEGDRGPGRGEFVELGRQILETLKDEVDLNITEVVDDLYDKDVKVSRIWGKEKRGNATKYDQILVMCKDLDTLKHKRFKKKANWDRNPIPYA
jgi:site-specific DNA-methyltransferase (adenine-specific)